MMRGNTDNKWAVGSPFKYFPHFLHFGRISFACSLEDRINPLAHGWHNIKSMLPFLHQQCLFALRNWARLVLLKTNSSLLLQPMLFPTVQQDKPPFPCTIFSTSLTRQRHGVARLRVRCIPGSWTVWWRLWWVPVGASLHDGGILSFNKSSAVLFSVVLLGNCNMPSSRVMRISSSFHGGSSERLPGARWGKHRTNTG